MYKYNLNDVKWGIFKVGDLFDRIDKGKCSNEVLQTEYSDVGISYLSATNRNNGVSNFVKKNSLFQKGNCIMFVNQGDGGAGFSVYKFEDFIATTSTSFGYSKWINKNTGLFISTILSQLKNKYSFGYGRTEKRLSNDKIKIPIDKQGNPNWEFMDNYIKERKQKQIKQLLNYFTKKLNNIKISDCSLSDTKRGGVDYKEFYLKSLFNFYLSSGDNQARSLNIGNIPLISSGTSDNGICKFILEGDGKSKLYNSGLITVDMFGKVFYHSYNFYSVSHGRINLLESKIQISEQSKKFIVAAIEKSTNGLFSYNRMCSQQRLQNIKIILPVDQNNNLNLDFMEFYIKQKEIKKIMELLNHFKEYL